MRFSDLASLDIKKIPTEVLTLLYKELYRELTDRRVCVLVSERKLKYNKDEKFSRIPGERFEYSKHKLKDFDWLMKQDWSHLFSGSEEEKFYVYAHVRPRKNAVLHDGEFKLEIHGIPFYIGKGCGSRAYDLKRNQGHGVELSQLLSSGKRSDEIVVILKDGLNEASALELESKLIYFFGTKFESGRKGILVNLDIPARPF